MRLEEARNFIWIAAVSVAVYFSPWPPSVGQFLTASIAAAAEDSGEDAKADENEEVEEEAKPIGLPLSARLKKLFANTPESVEDLKAMQTHIQNIARLVTPCTVAVQLRGGMGSGVIVSEDGYVLTAGHVVGRPDKEVTFIFPDGKKVKGKTLGADYGIDSGLMKITAEGKWPFVELGDSGDLETGHWCMAIGHPGGFRKDRSPPVRVGRIVHKSGKAIITDCTLVGGDSGGPLFDMSGKVIAIHSRIGDGLKANVHVPVNTYRDSWDRLADGDAWGGRRPGGPVIGVVGETNSEEAKVTRVLGNSPAEKFGVEVGDVITKFDGKEVKTFKGLSDAVAAKEPGDKVKVELKRNDETITLELVVGRRGG